MLSIETHKILFTEARSHKAWLNKEVTDEQIDKVYNLLKFAPTSGNCCPARFTFIKSDEAKKRLKPALDQGNIDKSMKILKWQPKYTITKSVQVTTDWYKKILIEKLSVEKITEKQIKDYMNEAK